MIAPSAYIRSKDFTTGSAVSLAYGLNVLNLSYGMYASQGYSVSQIGWAPEESSIISYASRGLAVVSKAAGNDSVAVGGAAGGKQDYLDLALIGKPSAIFVGALSSNGTTSNPAQLAWYSNYAGSDPRVQSHFLVVGVAGDTTGLYGTSFAAPIISGYAGVHQFCKVGAHAFIAMGCLVGSDVPPFLMMANEQHGRPRGINSEGLKRRGFESPRIAAIKRAYRTLYMAGLSLPEAREQLAQQAQDSTDVRAMLDFIDRSNRALAR